MSSLKLLGSHFPAIKGSERSQRCVWIYQCNAASMTLMSCSFSLIYPCWDGEWQTSESTKAKMHSGRLSRRVRSSRGHSNSLCIHSLVYSTWYPSCIGCRLKVGKKRGNIAGLVQYLCILNMFKFLGELIGAIHQ